MQTIEEGQCGLCKHFGGEDESPKLVQIRVEKEAPADLVSTCGNPRNEPLHLHVTPLSGCDGFEKAA